MKQVIVIRKDLNMRKGKMVAQGAHASLGAALIAYEDTKYPGRYATWVKEGQTKIVVGVPDVKDFFDLWHKVKQTNLPSSLIQDAGRTEFKEPTYTAFAIGPGEDSTIDSITGHLSLL